MKWNLKIVPHKENEQAIQELNILKEEIAAATNFLRKNRKNYFLGKKKIPIYLILGPSRFGKTTILSQAGLDLIDTDHQTLTEVNPTKYCSFWFTKDALYIDTAGTYTKPEITKPRNDLIWQGFIKLLQKYFGKNSIAGTLIILDLPAIAEDKNLLQRTLFCIRERIYEMATLVKNIHAHIIFTKCDRITGFTEFFSMLDTEERLQPFGIAFSDRKKSDPIPEFTAKFNELLKNLNNRVIENLHKTIRPQARSLIKIFPSQMDHLRSVLTEVISKIPNSSKILLSGMYFTSSIQNGFPIDPIKASIFQALNLKDSSDYHLTANNDRSYFVEGIFKKTINQQPQPKKKEIDITRLEAKLIYPIIIAILVIGLSATIAYKSYYKNIEAISQIQQTLQTNNLHDPDNIHAMLDNFDKTARSWWLTLGIDKTKTIYHELTKTHQLLFTQNLALQIENFLSSAINNQPTIDSQKIYRGLEAYLMLGEPKKLNKNDVRSWFNNYWQDLYGNDDHKNNLLKQLDSTMRQRLQISLNQQLITNVREYLSKLPLAQISYLLLENNYSGQKIEAGCKTTISKMYTKENFHKIYLESIPKIIHNPPQYDWVIGDLKTLFTTPNADTVAQELQNLYIEKYVKAWETALQLETKATTKNLAEIANATDSSLISLLKQVKHNVSLQNVPEKLARELDAKLHDLDKIDLAELHSHLSKLSAYINTIAQNHDVNQASFNAISKYFAEKNEKNKNLDLLKLKTFAEQQPPLLKNLLLNIINNIWQTLTTSAYQHITTNWDLLIIPQYRAILANKYPLFKDSKDDINLADFTKFFGPRGLMDDFFNQYIKPLVNTDKTNWTWKTPNNQKLDFPATFLEIFLRAALIQKMFYSGKSPTPKLDFALTPTGITPHTQGFSLAIDGQKISFTASDNKKIQHLVWPGPQPGSVTLSFINEQGNFLTTSEFGPWAWFRILDKANVTSSSSTKHFELTFDLNGNAAKYVLSTPEPLNPFIPEIITNFRCPELTNGNM